MKKVITGDEPFHPCSQVAGAIGATIRQEATLRFMASLAHKWVDPRDAAEEASKWADSYINQLNKDEDATVI